MKNQLKIAFGIALMSVFSVGCKKDSNKPSAEQATFTITSDTFKDGVVDHSLLRKNKINDPHLAWKNPPVGAKGYWIIMEDDKDHVYWNGNFKEKATSWEQNGIDHFSYSSFKLPDHNGTFATIEIFALNCTPTEFKNTIKKKINGGSIYKASRKTIREVLKQKGLSNMILGSAEVKYKVKPQVVAAADKDPSKPTQTAEPAPGVAKETTPNGGASLGEPNQVLVEKAKPIIAPTITFKTTTPTDVAFIVYNPSDLGLSFEYVEEGNEWESGGFHFTNWNNTAKISNLSPSKKYKVRLAYTVNSEKRYSDPLYFTTEAVQSPAPKKGEYLIANLTLKFESSTATTATFNIFNLYEFGPEASGKADPSLEYSEQIADDFYTEWAPPSYSSGILQNQGQIFGLNPSKKYKVRLVYRTADGKKTTNVESFETKASL